MQLKMFPFQPNYDLGFGTPTTSQLEHQIQGDLITDLASIENNMISFTKNALTANNQISFCTTSNVEATGSTLPERRPIDRKKECSIRKALHREIERKRRQEMSQLSASLASLLPRAQTKVRRSVPDQIEEAVCYIKEMENKIQELRNQRDKAKKSRKLSCSSANGIDKRVALDLVSDGMEILIFCNNEMSDLGLSQFLAVLVQTELDVVSCTSTTTKDGVFHKIKVEAQDMTKLDVSELEHRLRDCIISRY